MNPKPPKNKRLLDLIQQSYSVESVKSSLLNRSVQSFHLEPFEHTQHPFHSVNTPILNPTTTNYSNNRHNTIRHEDDSTNISSSSILHSLTVFQLVDSCAPTGGFAHSKTVETVRQLGFFTKYHTSVTIISTNALEQHVWDTILQKFTSNDPFLIFSCRLFRTCTHYNTNNKKIKMIPITIFRKQKLWMLGCPLMHS